MSFLVVNTDQLIFDCIIDKPFLILNASVLASGMSLMWLTLDTAFGENFPTCERSFLQVVFKANILSPPFVLED